MGFEQGGRKGKALSEGKQSGGLFSADVDNERSEAKGAKAPEKSHSLRQGENPITKVVGFLLCMKLVKISGQIEE